MKKRTTTQNNALYKLLGKLGISDDIKKELVFQVTNGRTEKSSEMSYTEASDLIRMLNAQIVSKERGKNELLQNERREVFKLMYDCGLIFSSDTTANKLIVINNWIEKKTAFKNKRLNDLNLDEISTLITQLRAVRRRYYEYQQKNAQLN